MGHNYAGDRARLQATLTPDQWERASAAVVAWAKHRAATEGADGWSMGVLDGGPTLTYAHIIEGFRSHDPRTEFLMLDHFDIPAEMIADGFSFESMLRAFQVPSDSQDVHLKISAPDAATYRAIETLLGDNDVVVSVANAKRRFLCVGELDPGLKQRIVDMGAKVSRDQQYNVEL